MRGGRAEQRDDDEGEFEKVEKEREDKYEGIDKKQEADLSARQRHQQMLHPDMPADAVESERENAGADQDEHHESRQLCCGFNRLADQVPGQAAFESAED